MGLLLQKGNLKLRLNNSRNNFAGHFSAVLIPVLLVLSGTAGVISPGSVGKKQRKVNRVKIRQRVGEKCRNAPEEGGKDFGHIMKVSGDSPPPAREEQ